MANPAIVEDLERLGWTGDEAVAQGWLDAAWIVVLSRFPDIEERMNAGSPSVDAAMFVVCQMTLRVLRNLNGRRQESVTVDDATHSWTLDQRVSSGELTIESDEYAMLSGRSPGKAFSLLPS